MGLRVVAEGIEDGATLDLLRELGCDLAQGYVISKPMPASELAFRADERRDVLRGRLDDLGGGWRVFARCLVATLEADVIPEVSADGLWVAQPVVDVGSHHVEQERS